MFSNRFDILISKIIFFILIHFQVKNTLNHHRYHNLRNIFNMFQIVIHDGSSPEKNCDHDGSINQRNLCDRMHKDILRF